MDPARVVLVGGGTGGALAHDLALPELRLLAAAGILVGLVTLVAAVRILA